MVVEAKSTVGSVSGIRYQHSDKEMGPAQEVCRYGIISDDPAGQHKEMRNFETDGARANMKNHRLEIVISPSKEESAQLKTREDWEDVVHDVMKKAGIDPHRHSLIAHKHTSTGTPHVHVKISRRSIDGKTVIDSQRIGERMGKAADLVAKDRGWATAKEQGRAAGDRASRHLREAYSKATSWKEVGENLQEKGYTLKLSQNEAKGIYGGKLILTENPKAAGWKFSQLQLNDESKKKVAVKDIEAKFEENRKQRAMEAVAARVASEEKREAGRTDYSTWDEISKNREQRKEQQKPQQKEGAREEKKDGKEEMSDFEAMRAKRQARAEQEREKPRGFRR